VIVRQKFRRTLLAGVCASETRRNDVARFVRWCRIRC
jgi:hypothetical protein